MTDSSPFPKFYLRYYGFLVGKAPAVHVADVIRPVNFAYDSKSLIDKYYL